jgi:WD40 repeat protein
MATYLRRAVTMIWLGLAGVALAGPPAPLIRDDTLVDCAFVGDDAVATSHSDGTVRLWSLRTGERTRTITVGKAALRGLVTVSPDSVLVVRDGDYVDLVNIKTAAVARTHGPWMGLKLPAPGPRGVTFAAGDWGAARWDVDAGPAAGLPTAAFGPEPLSPFMHLSGMTVSPSGTVVVLSFDWGFTRAPALAVLDGKTLKVTKQYTSGDLGGEWVRASALCPADDRLVAITVKGGAAVVDLRTDKVDRLAGDFDVAVCGLAYSPDGKRLVGTSVDGLVRVWDAQARKEVRSWRRPAGPAERMVWSPNGRRVAAAIQEVKGDPAVRVWDAETGIEVGEKADR